jgi:lysophospholipase L1-like esterase
MIGLAPRAVRSRVGYSVLSVVASLSNVGCDSAPSTAAGDHAPGVDASIADAHAELPPFSTIANRTLDSLDATEAEVLCAEKQRRVDGCKVLAVSTTKTADDCNRVTADCHAAELDSGLGHACGTFHFGPSGDCQATTDQYAACLDAWNAALTCDDAGFATQPPAECADVTALCPLAGDFRIEGSPRPCKPEERVDRPDTSDDIYGLDRCRPVPARFVVLGDSIAEGTGVRDAQSASNLLAGHLKATVAPDLTFERHTLAGARVHDLLIQMQQVTPGPGHVFVFIYASGADILASNFDTATLGADFTRVFDYFADTGRFTGGATFLLNTQYTTLDECYVAGAKQSLPASVVPVMIAMNKELFIDVAEARPDAVAVDQYPDFLGHGVNGNISGCPYCSTDNTPWTDDGIHPNVLGHATIAAHWIKAVDQMFESGCADAGPRR